MSRILDLGPAPSSQLVAYRRKTDAELQYIQRDASEAAVAMREVNPAAEAKYLDQVNDASTVLYERRQRRAQIAARHGLKVAA